MINLISAYFMRKWLKYAEICGNKGRSFDFKSRQTCNKTTISIIYRFQKNMQICKNPGPINKFCRNFGSIILFGRILAILALEY